MLPSRTTSCVLVTRDRRYLDEMGGLTSYPEKAVRLTRSDAVEFLSRVRPTGFNDPLRTLSVEELPKRDRRRRPPVNGDAAKGLIAATLVV